MANLNAKLQIELQRFAKALKVPAVTADVLLADGTFSQAVSGYRYRGCTTPATTHDTWHIGSCTKSITAALYARLVESNRTTWNRPVADLFPDLSGSLHPAWSQRSIDELLHCTSGLKGNLSALQMFRYWKDSRALDIQRTEVAETVLRQAPGTAGKFNYSNLGYILVGAAIDRLSDMTYEQALKQYLFDPLDIHSAGFGAPPSVRGHHSRLNLVFVRALPGKPANPANMRSDNPAVMASAGTLHVSLSDWSKFIRLFLNGGGDLLTQANLDHMLAIPQNPATPMAMGWAEAPSLAGVSRAMQGSNTLWAATALLDDDLKKASLVICNDGRSSVLSQSALLASRLLQIDGRALVSS